MNYEGHEDLKMAQFLREQELIRKIRESEENVERYGWGRIKRNGGGDIDLAEYALEKDE